MDCFHLLLAKYQTYDFNSLFSQQAGVKALELETLSLNSKSRPDRINAGLENLCGW